MKKSILIIFFLPLISFGQYPTEERSRLLEEYYLKSYSHPDSSKNRFLFFEVFPDTFNEYSKIYGEYGILNSVAYKHVVELYSSLSDLVGKESYYNKIISLAIGAEYTTDIGFFHFGVLWKKVKEDPHLTIKLLETKTDQEIVAFFSFLFDNVHPVKVIPEEFYFVKDYNEKMYSQMKQSLKEVGKKHKNDCH